MVRKRKSLAMYHLSVNKSSVENDCEQCDVFKPRSGDFKGNERCWVMTKYHRCPCKNGFYLKRNR